LLLTGAILRITKSENIQTNPKNLVGRALMSIMETDWRIKESNKQWIYVFAWYPFEYFLNVTKQTAKDIVRRKPKQ
jgi:hypothetical protein